jgi:hypothetical protein
VDGWGGGKEGGWMGGRGGDGERHKQIDTCSPALGASASSMLIYSVCLVFVCIIFCSHAFEWLYILVYSSFFWPRKQWFYSSNKRGERRGYERLTDLVTNVSKANE